MACNALGDEAQTWRAHVHALTDRLSEEDEAPRFMVDLLRKPCASDAALTFAHDQLHWGPWQHVRLVWRQIFTVASMNAALAQLASDPAGGAASACPMLDRALLLGAPIGESDRLIHAWLARLMEAEPLQAQSLLADATLGPSPGEAEACAAERQAIAARGSAIARLDVRELSLLRFQREFLEPCVPVVITGALADWPALSSRPWSSARYLLRAAGPRTVPVELGANYTDEAWRQTLMPFGEFLRTHVLAGLEGCAPSGTDGAGDAPGYLAQHALFDQIPALRRDVCIPDYCAVSRVRLPDWVSGMRREPVPEGILKLNAWIGPRGTVSQCHHDPYDNLFAQLVGFKYWRLYAPDQTERLYPRTDALGNTSSVDVADLQACERFPLFRDAVAHECLLGPGEMLFVPLHYWHYVASRSTSVSVSFWWS